MLRVAHANAEPSWGVSSSEDVECGKPDRNEKYNCQQSPQPSGLRGTRLVLEASEVADHAPVSFLNHWPNASPLRRSGLLPVSTYKQRRAMGAPFTAGWSNSLGEEIWLSIRFGPASAGLPLRHPSTPE